MPATRAPSPQPRSAAPTVPAMPTRAIRDVELVAVGTWSASTGVTTITRADLEAVLEAHADGIVDAAPVKLGHRSKLNDELGDGAPAFGWVVPTGIRKGKGGADTLVGDLVGIPSKLAEVAPTAYRRRSVELAWGVKAGGKTYKAVLTAVSLLGVQAPAVKRLDDVLALYSGAPAGLEVEGSSELELVDGLEGKPAAVALLSEAAAAGATVDVLDVLARRLGASDTATIPTDVADDAETPQQTPPTQEAPTMARTYSDEQLRELLSLEADADVDAALRQLATADPATQPGAPGGAPANPEQTPDTSTTPASTPTGEPEAPAPVGDQPAPTEDRAPELVTLSAANHAELTELATWARDRRRAEVLDTAVREGRIAPAERTAFAAQLERDEAGTTTLLSSLAPRFAVSELGSSDAPEVEDATVAKAFDEFEARTFGLNR